MCYLKMVGKKVAGSGLSNVLLEAGLIVSGSLNGVLKGKNYDRPMDCHKTLLEGLEQLLLEKKVPNRTCLTTRRVSEKAQRSCA